ncbi:uncharacterized protein LOC132258258 [Phlebotomus argentipes]|uniref:uncharacterized protein LOC132258258 n=1 Tax=Phlebotomus argentipes TaxID=94469 RepID=UPI002893571C|nr:uncharacterized protein LOC132258258 [Phlebotomus argentipes]
MARKVELMAEIKKISDIVSASDSNWDVIEVTQLLKSLGLQLDKLGFDTAAKEGASSGLSVEIRCGTSNIVSKLSQAQRICICPENGHNSSFWEVQGTAPGAIKQEKMDETSSNLLPDISKCVNDGVKALMQAALQLLNNKNGQNSDANKENTEPQELNTSSSTQILSSSPKIDVCLKSMRADTDRDIAIIQQLSEARYKVDQALLMLQLNKRTDGIQGSLQMNTPQKPTAASSPHLPSLKKYPSLGLGLNKLSEKPSVGILALPPRKDARTRRSMGSLLDTAPSQLPKKEPPAIRVSVAANSGATPKLKPMVKQNITSSLRKSLTNLNKPQDKK